MNSLLPGDISCVFSDAYPDTFFLLQEELATTHNMSAKRRLEFNHGRSCARQALQQLGYPNCPIPVSEDRAPIWPTAVVGSISHCGSSAAAVVAKSNAANGLGIDLEERVGLDSKLLTMICCAEELASFNGNETDRLLAKVIFSAKESLYKCVWPEIRRFIDFLDVEIQLDLKANTFAARSRNNELPAELFLKVSGRFGQTHDKILTAAMLG